MTDKTMGTDAFSEVELAAVVDEFEAHFANRPVLVTGADGFLGSHLCDALQAMRARVHAVVRPRSERVLRRLTAFGGLKVHWADLCDRGAVDRVVRELAVDGERPYVFHFAAFSHVGHSWTHPHETVNTNVLGTINLLQAIVDQELDLQCFDQAGSSEEYGNLLDLEMQRGSPNVLDELSEVAPESIYGSTKACQDYLARNYYSAYGVPVIVVRMFNQFGPRQSTEFVTGTIISQALTSKNVILGDLTPRRDFTFCADGIRAHLGLAAKAPRGDVYCYGSGLDTSIGDWAKLILRLGKQDGYWADRQVIGDVTRHRPGLTEVRALRVNFEKIQKICNWQPTVSWEEGIRRTLVAFGRRLSTV